MWGIRARAALLCLPLVAWAAYQASRPEIRADLGACQTPYPFGWSEPEQQGLSPQALLDLTKWVEASHASILSLLVSRNGQIVYELYTSSIQRDEAHYLMSVTKSVTSALAGAAIARGLMRADETLPEILPRHVFPDEMAVQRFQRVTLKDVLGMSALDAQVAPHPDTRASEKRFNEFFNARNRVAFALSQALLPAPGRDFQYTDVTPSLAAGAIEYSSGMTLLDFANRTLFGPMDFKNQEWMHEDSSGIDNGAYGLRLRPVDMQKFGILYLDEGCWEGKRLLQPEWTRLSFEPWIRSQPGLRDPNYGWYWWQRSWPGGGMAAVADGWKGQRIAVFPEWKMVVTMTAIIESASEEDRVFGDVIGQFATRLRGSASGSSPPDVKQKLGQALRRVSASKRVPAHAEARMIPSVKAKERHAAFNP